MNKKLTSLLLALVMIFSMLATAVPAYAKSSEPAITISVVPNKTEVHPGDTISYQVILGPVNNWADCEFAFVIPEGLTYVSATVSDEVADHFQGGWTEKTKRFVVYGGKYTSDSDTLLLTVTCTVEESAVGKNLKVYLNDPFFCDRTGADYVINNYDESISLNYDSGNSVTVSAAPVAVTGVTIDETLSLKIGETKTPGFSVSPAEAANKAVSFKSGNPAVATVNETTGAVTGVKEGTATITITTADGGFTDTCTVTVCANQDVVIENSKDIKWQVTNGTNANSATTNLRLLTWVNSPANYSSVTFNVTINGRTSQLKSTTAYTAILAAGVAIRNPANIFKNSEANYFVTYTLKNVPSAYFDIPIVVTVTWTDLQGNKTTSESKTIVIASDWT